MSEEKWRKKLERQRRIRELFERKFINYRDKMLDIYYSLEEGNPLKSEIKSFLQDEQGDVEFGKR